MNLTIREFAAQTGVSLHTLRYYEKIGLIDPVRRAANGHRSYSEADLRRVDFLKRLRATGMSISEMQYYVKLFHMGDETLAERRKMLEDHRAAVQAQIESLLETCDLLDRKIANYKQQEQHNG